MVVAVAFVGADRGVRALACAVGGCVADEAGPEDRADDGAQGVTHDAVTERCGRDEAFLGIADNDLDATTGPIAAGQRLALQAQQLTIEIGKKRRSARLSGA